MLRTNENATLTRRLLTYYLASALATVLACLVIGFGSTGFGKLPRSPILLVCPLAVVIGGAFCLYRVVRVNANIESQLARIGAGEVDLAKALMPMRDCAAATR